MIHCAYSFLKLRNSRARKYHEQYVHWSGRSVEFVLLYAQLERIKSEDRLLYAVAYDDELHAHVYEFGDDEQVEHAKTVLGLQS